MSSGLTPAIYGPSREQAKGKIAAMYEAPAMIGTCINCIAPGSLLATLTVIVVGIGIAVTPSDVKQPNIQVALKQSSQ
jgi:hypothetical protein